MAANGIAPAGRGFPKPKKPGAGSADAGRFGLVFFAIFAGVGTAFLAVALL